MNTKQNNIINFRQNGQITQPYSNASGEYVLMPFVVLMPVFMPAKNAENSRQDSSKKAAENNENNVVSIYDHLGEI